jgi:L-seryl-tRNA(Ser) seleniumtransferase
MSEVNQPVWRPPSLDALLRSAEGQALMSLYGRKATAEELRFVLAECRKTGRGDAENIFGSAALALAMRRAKSIKTVYNLTGSVLHTNLGRAPLSDSAIAAMNAAGSFVNLEYDLDGGLRGERDHHIEGWLKRLTGAEAGIAVNNNAAAVLAVLNALSWLRLVVHFECLKLWHELVSSYAKWELQIGRISVIMKTRYLKKLGLSFA